MRTTLTKNFAAAVPFIAFALACGCTAASPTSSIEYDPEPSSTTPESAPIVNGSKATSHSEAVLIDMYEGGQLSSYCSGSVIAPRVVLTAGHCVHGISQWKIKAPFANGQTAQSSKGLVYDWNTDSETVDPNLHDLGLIILDTPITLSQYPTLATKAVSNGTKGIAIGRINNGSLSTTALYMSQAISLSSGQSIGYPYDYQGSDIIQSGDSGGPVELTGSAPYTIVAVNSGGGGGAVFARVDLLSSWIQSTIQANGGPGSSGGGTGGAGGSAGSGGSGGSAPPSTTCTGGTQETEANDSYTAADKLTKLACGGLASTSDEDWFTWTASSKGISYDLVLSSSSDFELQMWKKVNGSFYAVTNTTPTEFTYTTSGAATYYLVVFSPTGKTGSYTLNLVK
ncbi:MAG: trypsin-like serine protease [Deltaproteobacteria bacterium]|nr:trypsin-like serine protease [Deltaproteobacteria bacterium]